MHIIAHIQVNPGLSLEMQSDDNSVWYPGLQHYLCKDNISAILDILKFQYHSLLILGVQQYKSSTSCAASVLSILTKGSALTHTHTDMKHPNVSNAVTSHAEGISSFLMTTLSFEKK